MIIRTVFAHLSCSDLAASSAWYATLFGSPATRTPMPGLAEWQITSTAAIQLFEDESKAGASTLTLQVTDPAAERSRLEEAGLKPGAVEEATTLRLVRLRDPDGNLVVLAGDK